ncbi:P-loop containing nucleoside triphosphate hydrolase protein [Pleurotus eryngii]|uniref:P-loop containing nucleoside triphosphate hydrolase protein n=1 Tax=Pleurotus eryngii TaxID=5323 RepID=A0A9P5ZL48_PLEER|nr:P-loop containing nucleoside triphosphate hydrolase protein [Pleurotus eryngii]
MDGEAIKLAQFLVQRLRNAPPDCRLLVGITGIPASGKSTFAARIVERTRAILHDLTNEDELSGSTAVLVGLDGWHFTRAQLDQMPDPKLAHDRRGIHWTFDAAAYVAFLKSLRSSNHRDILLFPSFDHAVKDPIPDSLRIEPSDRIVLVEGLYTLLDVEPWVHASKLLDERWLMDVDFEEARRRLVERHIVSGVAKDREEAVWRAENNDIPNGWFVIANSLEPTRVIQSINEPTLEK